MCNLFACLSEMAGHALYGMAPCFGHTGVTFDVENDRPGPGSLRGNFETEGFVLRLYTVLLEVQWENCYTTWLCCWYHRWGNNFMLKIFHTKSLHGSPVSFSYN